MSAEQPDQEYMKAFIAGLEKNSFAFPTAATVLKAFKELDQPSSEERIRMLLEIESRLAYWAGLEGDIEDGHQVRVE